MRRAEPERRRAADRLRESEHLLGLIVGMDTAPSLLELRMPGRAHRPEFFHVHRVADVARRAAKLAELGDVFVSMAPRQPYASRRTGLQWGGSAAIHHGWVISADCDGDDALDALAAFTPLPSMVVASGSTTPSGRQKLHAHWGLAREVSRPQLEIAKRRLSVALGSDGRIKDAARVMRLPGTLNWKGDPPTMVEALSDHPERLYRLGEVLDNCPAIDERRHGPRKRARPRETVENARNEGEVRQSQEKIPPAQYLRDLAGVEVNEHGKAHCPFHDDRTPSLHCYPDASAGWYCFGCERGGDLYTFAGLLLGISQRDLVGRNFARTWEYVRRHYGLPVELDE